MFIGIVICSRLKSSRLPNKAHLLLENRTVLGNLLFNIKDLGLPIVVTVPNSEFNEYLSDETLPRAKNILIHNSDHELDPLARTAQVAKQFKFDAVVRITHDKIFIDTDALKESLKAFTREKADYLFSSSLIPGTNFEIISYKCLLDATNKYKNVEHISYAVRQTSKKSVNYTYRQNDYGLNGLSLLLDYEDDFKLLQVIYSKIGVNARLPEVLRFLSYKKHLININKKPLVSIYTCAYNSNDFIQGCIESVLNQSIFESSCEYLMIDDCSNDGTFETMAMTGLYNKNVSFYRNQLNYGLSTSSNIALSKARGKYIIRLDSDDYFINNNSIENMVNYAMKNSVEILYPDNLFGDVSVIQKGKDCHHVGGSLFDKNALNFVKFTDGLRGFEGYDLFLRAKDRLKIGYYNEPVFFYSQRDGSLSKSNKKFRDKIKTEIEVRVSNEKI